MPTKVPTRSPLLTPTASPSLALAGGDPKQFSTVFFGGLLGAVLAAVVLLALVERYKVSRLRGIQTYQREYRQVVALG